MTDLRKIRLADDLKYRLSNMTIGSGVNIINFISPLKWYKRYKTKTV